MKFGCLGIILMAISLIAVGHGSARAGNAEAEELFRSGQQLLRDGNLDAACAAFAKSDKVEPNINTQLNLGDCEEKRGRYAAAWRVFVAVEQATQSDPERAAVNAVARQRVGGLVGKLSFLEVTVPPSVAELEGLEILIDDQPLSSSFWNAPVAIDAGVHRVEARAPGYTAHRQEVMVSGDRARVAVTIGELTAEAGAVPSSAAASTSIDATRWLVGADLGREEMRGALDSNFFVGVAAAWHRPLAGSVFFRATASLRYQNMGVGPSSAVGGQIAPAFGLRLLAGKLLLAWQPTFGYSSAGDQLEDGADIDNTPYFYGKFMLVTAAYVATAGYEVGVTLNYDTVIGHDETYELGAALRYPLGR